MPSALKQRAAPPPHVEIPSEAEVRKAAAALAGDPRSLAVLSQTLRAFLDEINGGDGGYHAAEQAYRDAAEAPPAIALAAIAPAPSPFAATLEKLAADFATLSDRLDGAGRASQMPRQPGDVEAITGLKADVRDFAGALLKAADDIATAALAQPQARVAPQPAPPAVQAPVPTPAAAQPATAEPARPEPAPAPEPSSEKRSLLGQLSARFHRHMQEL